MGTMLSANMRRSGIDRVMSMMPSRSAAPGLRSSTTCGGIRARLERPRFTSACNASASAVSRLRRRPLPALPRPLQVQRKQPREEIVVGEVGGPPICGEHSFIESLVGEIEPRRPFVVEVREGPLREFLRGGIVGGYGPRIADGADSLRVRLGDVSVSGCIDKVAPLVHAHATGCGRRALATAWATAAPSSIGTALTICLATQSGEPEKRNSSGNPCSRAHSRDVSSRER
jgi:hypothetical protein